MYARRGRSSARSPTPLARLAATSGRAPRSTDRRANESFRASSRSSAPAPRRRMAPGGDELTPTMKLKRKPIARSTRRTSRRSTRSGGALAAAAAPMALLAAGAAAKDTNQPRGPWLTDQHGRVLLAHGIDLVAERHPTRRSPWASTRRRRRVPGRARGFDTVRLGVPLRRRSSPSAVSYDEACLCSTSRSTHRRCSPATTSAH